MPPYQLIDDPYAITAFRNIDYPWERFGDTSTVHARRALLFDEAIRDYVRQHPRATVVALAEGLQTTFWRLSLPFVRWLSIDTPEMISIRSVLFPDEARVVPLSLSALDLSWTEAVGDPADGVIITAEGLFMYLDREEILRLVSECAYRYPGGRLLFDSVPRWFSAKTRRGLQLSEYYTIPPMLSSFSSAEADRVFKRIPGVEEVTDMLATQGSAPLAVGWGNPIIRRLSLLPNMRSLRPARTMISFGSNR